MYIIRNNIRVICSKIRVGMVRGPYFTGICTPGSIFRGGGIFNMTPGFNPVTGVELDILVFH